MGGSILTIPILVYLMKVSPMDATAYSLFIVGITSSVGGARYVRDGFVELRTASIFAAPSIVSVFLTRRYLLPVIPDPVPLGTVSVPKDLLVLLLFALLMMVVGYRMLRDTRYPQTAHKEVRWMHYLGLVILGATAGFITGVLGVGGGFIIIPALVLLARIPIHMSVGTSLLIIALNSWIGFTGELLVRKGDIDFGFLLLFSLFSIAGILLGFRLARRIDAMRLKKAFGWIVLVTGVCIFIKETFFL